MLEAQRIMEEAQRTGEDPEGKLNELVQEAVRRGVQAEGADGAGAAEGESYKRSRAE